MTSLIICPICNNDHVHPIVSETESLWDEHTNKPLWLVTLRCGSCEDIRQVTAGQYALDLYDDDLQDAEDMIWRDLDILAAANMNEWIESFMQILPHLEPMDFGVT